MTERKKIAAIVRTWGPGSHTGLIASKLVTGLPTMGGLLKPQVDLVSLYMGQMHPDNAGLAALIESFHRGHVRGETPHLAIEYKPPSQASPVRFRNYILRRLLEHHFHACPLQSQQYDLVLDRIDTTREDAENLRQYISGNRNIPTPTYITHASSIYVEGLQLVHHIANGYKDVVGGDPTPPELSFVNPRDLTTNQYVL